MYARLPTTHKRMAEYAGIIGEQAVAELRELARPLRQARLLHLTSTAFGSGAPEELMALVPLLSDLGLDVDWQVLRGSAEYARAAKAINNALGGLPVRAPDRLLDIWVRYNTANAGLFDAEYDFVVVHDPAAAGLPESLRSGAGQRGARKWLWHCHFDLSAAQAELWRQLRRHLDCCYDAAIFSADEYVRRDLDVPRVVVMPPAIDPLSTRNMEIDPATQARVLERFGIDPHRPLICQIARFVKRGDPFGGLEAYRMVKEAVPEVQFVVVWTLPAPNAEGWQQFQRLAQLAAGDPDVHLLSNLNEVGNVEQNVLQRAARVVVHRALRKGFASTVAEASWKKRPVIADRKGIMPLQVLDGQTGYVVETVEQLAERLVRLLKDRTLADELGQRGHEHVTQRFLISRAVRDYLQLLNDFAQKEHAASAGS